MYTMRPAAFEYHRPASLEEALELLGGDGEARPLAGGHSLLPMMKVRLSTPTALVDLAGIEGLDGITRDGDSLVIGALATHASVAASELVRSECPVLAETASLIGDRQVRNRGTIGGSVAHADPAADYPTVLLALEATVSVAGREGTRDIPADDCFVDVFTTAIRAGELVVSVRVPVTGAGTGAAYVKHRHPASSYAVAGACAVVTVEGGTCSRARLVVGGVTGSPVVVAAAGEELVGKEPSDDAIAAAAAKVPEALEMPLEDTYASGEYRRHLAEVIGRRALETAFERSG